MKYPTLNAVCNANFSNSCKKNVIITFVNFKINLKKNGRFLCKACSKYKLLGENKGPSSKLVKNFNFFEIIDTEIKAYLLGILAGDGNISKYYIHIVSHINDIETLMLFKFFISPLSNIRIFKNTKCAWINIPSQKLAKDAANHLKVPFGKKSYFISIPDCIKNNEKLLWAFIRGLIDTDGYLTDLTKSKHSFPRCSYASKSDIIKNQIKIICDTYNIKYTCDKISIVFNGINALNFLNKVYENSNFSLTRKRCLYKIFTTWVPQKGSIFRPRKIRKDKGMTKKYNKEKTSA